MIFTIPLVPSAVSEMAMSQVNDRVSIISPSKLPTVSFQGPSSVDENLLRGPPLDGASAIRKFSTPRFENRPTRPDNLIQFNPKPLKAVGQSVGVQEESSKIVC